MQQEIFFQKAVPVWEKGKTCAMNQMIALEAVVESTEALTLRIAGHTGYRVFVNGELLHLGPARAGQGWYRVEELPILKKGEVTVTVVATGYYCRSFYWVREPSFVCAELIAGGKVLAHTGDDRWHAFACPDHLQKVHRYSYQRTFCEVYDLRTYPRKARIPIELEQTEPKHFIAREIPISAPGRIDCRAVIEKGRVTDCERGAYWNVRFSEPGENVDGFYQSELDFFSLRAAEKMDLSATDPDLQAQFPQLLDADTYLTVAMEGNRTGLIELDVDCHSDADLYLTFDEILSDGTINFTRLGCANVVTYRLSGGKHYHLITAEPYTLGYLNVISRGGAIRVNDLSMRYVGFDKRAIVKKLNVKKADATIARIYHAALESFCQNTYDVYMDCPSRERAGWLCDSFFTSRVEHLMTGKSAVERNFLSNYAMVDHFEGLPDGMLPMCYPSDTLNSEFIPNWAMWFALELAEYYERTGDRSLVEELRQKLYALLGYFRHFENTDGLLQSLDGWIFVEWSHCNKLVQDVNYPTNMLYYRFKRALASLYGDADLERESAALRACIRKQSRTGLFFCDNAVLDANGTLQLSGEVTETCQYYAFYMGVASVEEDAELWQTMVEEFGPDRRENNRHPCVHFSNAFIGNYMRLDLLANAGYLEKLEENIRGYFDYMARQTGTLWENVSNNASCNHGFASHVLVWLHRLGYLE